jgi:glycosyltransferase involved in cell wall biosynthesis
VKVIYRAETGHISAASNTALSLATGEFVALMDHDDEIPPNALYEFANMLSKFPDADLIYSDEDKINQNNTRYDPFFKPDWSPDLLLSQMYSGHLSLYRRSLVEQIGGFREGYEGSQDYDLVLRFTELTDRIHHIPKVLYHWRTVEGSTAADPTAKEYAYVAGRRALQDAIDRRDAPGSVTRVSVYHGQYIVDYSLDHHPAVSIVIPTWNRTGLQENLNRCLDSLFANTDYENYEVIIVGSQVSDSNPFHITDQLKQEYGRRLRVIDSDLLHNSSQLINNGTQHASGKFIALLGDSLIIQNRDWLRKMIGQAQRQNIGAVGGLICNDNETVRSAGIVINSSNKVIDMHHNMPTDSPGYFGRLLISVNCSAVRSNFLVIKKSLLEEKGGIDESLTDGFADIDLGLWLKKHGYQNLVLSHVRAVQSSAVEPQPDSTYASDDHQSRQMEFLRHRWGNQLDQDPFYNLNLSRSRANFRLDDSFVPELVRNSMAVYLELES